ncbi:Gastrin-releasing peptide, partial [Camelus dromedarius]
MRGREFPLVLLALVVCQAPRGPAAPVSAGGGTLLAKMYPRGNHWAVAWEEKPLLPDLVSAVASEE